LKMVAFEAMESSFLGFGKFQMEEQAAVAHMSLYAMYHPSTRSRAQGVLRRNVRLDLTLGS
jgi:pyoverdine/dityrosine biosynthesis protein Dit1